MTRFVERALTLLFTLVRVGCLMPGLGLLAALLAAPTMHDPELTWLQTTLDGLLRAGGILVATGVALVVADRFEPRAGPEPSKRGSSWPAALGATMVLLVLLALLRSGELLLLWTQVSGLLDQAGFSEEFARGGQGSGLVMLPILVALMVPALATVVTFFLVVVPPLLLVPLVARSPRFPVLFLMLAVTQTGLALCSFAVAGTLGGLVSQAMTSMQASGEAEVLHAAEIAAQLIGRTDAIARGFALPVLGFLLWVPFLLLAAAPRSYFVATPATDPA